MGGRAPGVAGSASVSGAQRGLAFFVARRPHLSLAFLPPSPQPPSQWEGGDFRLFYARGFAPCIPGLNPRGTGSTCRCRRLNGGRAPGVAGSVSVSGAQRGAFPPCRPPPPPLACFSAPYPPARARRAIFPGGEGGDFWLSYARGFAPCIPGNRPGAALAMLAGNRFFGRSRGNTCFAAVKSASGQSIIEKSSWGFGGFFQEAPNVSPVSPVPPRCTPPHAGRNCKLHKNAQNG